MVSICIHCDSQAAIGSVGCVIYNSKSHHIRRRHNAVRQLLFSGIIIIDYINSKDNVPDPLIKCLTRDGVERLSTGIRLWSRKRHRGGNST
ncbi:hypothetical protein MTR67_052923 [Solanum verrucosum]|uniref:Uncharacterized protein n=1 Tax=Solanum verrucosum TaxID=315347 RepID=A0AAF1A390_SOLVR|nr:hypothetical protein MTR67_052923 [Solanum verrucosum]